MGIIGEAKKRILIINSDSLLYESLKPKLESIGYDLDYAMTKSDAKRMFVEKPYYYIIIDFYFDNYSPKKPGGKVFLKELNESDLIEYDNIKDRVFKSSVFVTSDKDVINEWEDISKVDILYKNDLSVLVDLIDNRFKNNETYNWDIIIEDNLEEKDIILISRNKIILIDNRKKVLCERVELLLRMLFKDKINLKKIIVTKYYEQGHSGALILRVIPQYNISNFDVQKYLIKIQSNDRCNKENQNYINIVSGTGFANKANIVGVAYQYDNIGALLYEIKKSTKTLRQYIEEPMRFNEKVQEWLNKIIRELEENWYSKVTWKDGFFSKEQFQGIYDTVNIREIFTQVFPEFNSQIENDIISINIYDQVFELNNPLKRYPFRDIEVTKNPESLIHGDLHFGNIMIQNENDNPYIIDYLSIRRGHTFCDFAKLEESLINDEMGLNDYSDDIVCSHLMIIPGLLLNSSISESYKNIKKNNLHIKTQNLIMLISEIRSLAYNVIKRIMGAENIGLDYDFYFYKQYYISLLREMMLSWYWIKDYSKVHRILNLMIVSNLIDYCYGNE